MIVRTTCKFCARPIEMDVDEAGFNNPEITAEKWLEHIACNRCADYYRAKAKLGRQIGFACNLLIQSRNGSKVDEKAIATLKAKMEIFTKELCKLICDFKMIQFVWDQDFVEMLMEKPEKFSQIINLYCARLNKLTQ